MIDFISMNGYGPYIWSAYVFAFIILGYLFFSNSLKLNTKQKQLDKLLNKSD
tara:strand:- start:672 stop:827 length:156 start_codon:yes stop_codon:yes gene_type:complete